MKQHLRMGKIAYTNVLPLYEKLNLSDLSVEEVSAVPARLNQMLALGQIDFSSISSFSYALNWRDYRLLPGISISSKKEVGSVILFTDGIPLTELDGKTVALSNQSAASVHLLRVILEKYIGIKPTYLFMEPDLPMMLKHAKAALLIGDAAIQARWEQPQKPFYDLATLWHKYTNETMTFAVWAVRKEVLQYRGLLKELHQRFLQAKEAGLQALPQVIKRAQAGLGGDRDFWHNYYTRQLSYDFGEQERKGLEKYFQDLQEIGVLEDKVPIQLIEIEDC